MATDRDWISDAVAALEGVANGANSSRRSSPPHSSGDAGEQVNAEANPFDASPAQKSPRGGKANVIAETTAVPPSQKSRIRQAINPTELDAELPAEPSHPLADINTPTSQNSSADDPISPAMTIVKTCKRMPASAAANDALKSKKLSRRRKNSSASPVVETVGSLPVSDEPDNPRNPHVACSSPELLDGGHSQTEHQARIAAIGSEIGAVHAISEIQSPSDSAETELPGQNKSEIQMRDARQTPSDQASDVAKSIGSAPDRDQIDDGQYPDGNLATHAIVDLITELHRRRWDMVRARQRLELQAQAVCRRLEGGDKAKAAKLWAVVRKDEGHPLRSWLAPYLTAMRPLLDEQSGIEKRLVSEVKKLPIYQWAQGMRGFGDLSLSAVIGECGIGPGDFKSVSALWKRMGLAVIGGERQRRISGAEAIEHGYNAQRRSIMWNIGDLIIRAQVRVVKDQDGAATDERMALGELGQLYLDRKAYEAERVETAAHAHNRAKRYMEKRLLRQLWQAWRQIKDAPESSLCMSVAEPFPEAAE